MISLDQALGFYDQHIHPLPVQKSAISAALGLVLARTARATIDLPRFDASAMDGYAVNQSEATAERKLQVVGVAAPAAGSSSLPPGCACRIYTGAPIPDGADTVIPQEQVERESDSIRISQQPLLGANIRRRAEELTAGTEIANAGQKITPGLLAALAMAGVAEVHVHRPPRIAVLVTGDELKPAGAPLAEHEIVDSNGPLITAILQHWGLQSSLTLHVEDDFASTQTAMTQALANADLVITSGGASVGDRDFVPKAAEAAGVRPVFWKVAQKPGKPIFFGMREQTALLALPGNPAAVLVGMLVHASCILDRMAGVSDPAPWWRTGLLDNPQQLDSRRELLLRMCAYVNEEGVIRLAPLPGQGSHRLANLSQANALVRIPVGGSILGVDARVAFTLLPATQLFAGN